MICFDRTLFGFSLLVEEWHGPAPFKVAREPGHVIVDWRRFRVMLVNERRAKVW